VSRQKVESNNKKEKIESKENSIVLNTTSPFQVTVTPFWLITSVKNFRRKTAANRHISKQRPGRDPKWTGEWLSSDYRDAYFSIRLKKRFGESSYLWQEKSGIPIIPECFMRSYTWTN